MNCPKCSGKMREKKGNTPEGVSYNYFRCNSCGEEIVNMQQLHAVADKYRSMKKYTAKLSKWGQSIGLRIPKPLLEEYSLKQNQEVTLIPEKNAIKIVSK